MTHIVIKIHANNDKEALFPDLEPGKTEIATLEEYGIMQQATMENKTGVIIKSKTEDGKTILTRLTAKQFLCLAAATRGAMERFGEDPDA